MTTLQKDRVFCGTVVHATDVCALQVLENAALGVQDGKVVFLDTKDRLNELLREHGLDAECVIHLKPRQWVMPGLVDCHIHSPQLPIQALGTDLGLLDWLNIYAFPAEARYADPNFARDVHRAMVMRTLRGGTTSASYYATIHTDTSLFLCQAADELGQRAFVGKCNQDRKSPDYYIETTEESLAETERFIREVQSLKSDLVTPVVTPRFGVSCTEPLMKELGKLARSNDVPIQTHMSETLQELDNVSQLFPGHETYADVYDAMGLVGPKTILAHCIHVSDRELDLFVKRGCGVVHCACSNITLRSGLMDIRRQLNRGIKLGLGTDVGAGYTTSMLVVMRHSVDVSNVRAILHQQQDNDVKNSKGSGKGSGKDTGKNIGKGSGKDIGKCSGKDTGKDSSSSYGWGCSGSDRQEAGPDGRFQNGGTVKPYQPLTMEEAFRLATLGGSADIQDLPEAFHPKGLDVALSLSFLGQNCGNFEPGREFDALLVDPEVKDSPLDLFPFDTAKDVALKFLYYGDDRNIVKVYVQGREVVDKTA